MLFEGILVKCSPFSCKVARRLTDNLQILSLELESRGREKKTLFSDDTSPLCIPLRFLWSTLRRRLIKKLYVNPRIYSHWLYESCWWSQYSLYISFGFADKMHFQHLKMRKWCHHRSHPGDIWLRFTTHGNIHPFHFVLAFFKINFFLKVLIMMFFFKKEEGDKSTKAVNL